MDTKTNDKINDNNKIKEFDFDHMRSNLGKSDTNLSN